MINSLFNGIADNQWHYNCTDMYEVYKASVTNQYPRSSIQLLSVKNYNNNLTVFLTIFQSKF